MPGVRDTGSRPSALPNRFRPFVTMASEGHSWSRETSARTTLENWLSRAAFYGVTRWR